MDETKVRKAIAAELRAERSAKQLTIAHLAEAAGIPEVSLNRYLSGARDVPSSKIIALAGALRIDPGALLDRALDRARGEDL